MEQKKWGPVTEGARISVSVPQRRFQAGEPIPVELSMKNADTIPMPVVNRSPWLDYALEVLGPDGAQLPLLESAKRKMETLAESGRAISQLMPDQEISVSLQLEQGYDLTAPGVYRVKASRQIYRKGSLNQFATVVSTTIEIQVI